ncbi:glycosyltransferase [Flavobacterium sp. Fl-77]|uniref:Glycosyltransferase n=1 Tax=Flavobacterium flavipigmentatum TaxID=2893884 RepID=A0AAJ2VXI2_9FLAO|nr:MULTISPECIES: glycosyltransferase [unclassified Flavobacterium]MDX6181656.1 glycosyltransferase [Flavobacterium sp. Fl-33]MDX6185310.1 glycosyltransferase [Flavobacterium sp. Fl-77]UFH37415.1 glycosyltransferase family 4 protein [Flavobacterium sp. F-70]
MIIDTKVPEYNKDSGSRRLTEIIKLLITNKVGVFLLADFKELKFRTEYVQYFKDLGVVVYEPSLDASGKLITKNKFIELILPNVNFAWLHRPEIFEKYYPIVNKNKPLIKIFFDMVDFHYLRFKRESELTGDTEIMKIANKYLSLELDNCQKADKIIVISDFEKQNLKGYYRDEDKMIAIGNIHQFIKSDASKCFQDRKDLLFIGGFEHKPNVDAVHYLHNEIMPLLWNTDPEIVINIIGSNVSKEILALHSEKFKILGYVEDVSAYFLESRVFVAPLRYGAGIKGKIGQSLEFGLPLVTTKIGAEGFDFKENTNWIVADKKEEIVKNILEIYKDETLWNKISSDSEMVIEPFSNNTIEKKIISLVR